MRLHLPLALILSFIFATTAFAAPQEDVNGEEVPQGVNSVNFSPIGFMFGSYALNYERLIDESHGFLGELSYSSSSKEGSSSTSSGLRLGYRWHWSKSQNSGFLGAMLAYDMGTTEQTLNGTKYDLTLSAPSVTVNIGRRWAWTSGFNVTLRFGVGRAFRTLSTSDKSDEAQEAIAEANEILDALPVTLDGELSIGWIF